MKLLMCTNCLDIFNLRTDAVKSCSCGKSYGKYDDNGLNAWYAGPCEMLGFANYSFGEAILKNKMYPPAREELGHKFRAFIIPEAAPTIRRSSLEEEVDKIRKAS